MNKKTLGLLGALATAGVLAGTYPTTQEKPDDKTAANGPRENTTEPPTIINPPPEEVLETARRVKEAIPDIQWGTTEAPRAEPEEMPLWKDIAQKALRGDFEAQRQIFQGEERPGREDLGLDFEVYQKLLYAFRLNQDIETKNGQFEHDVYDTDKDHPEYRSDQIFLGLLTPETRRAFQATQQARREQ